MLLPSPLKIAAPADAAVPLPSACRITHGPNDGMFSVAGRSVASIRRSLATVFSIPGDSEAFVGGSVVDGQYRLRAGCPANLDMGFAGTVK